MPTSNFWMIAVVIMVLFILLIVAGVITIN